METVPQYLLLGTTLVLRVSCLRIRSTSMFDTQQDTKDKFPRQRTNGAFSKQRKRQRESVDTHTHTTHKVLFIYDVT